MIRWVRRPDGSLAAETVVGGIRVAGVMSAHELGIERDALPREVGFSLSLKTLGHAMAKIASPGAVLKLAQNVSEVVDKVPGLKAALIATGPVGMGIMGGLAATKALAKAKAGDPHAKAIVAQAARVAELSPSAAAALPMPQTRDGQIVRWIVALQRLD